MALTGTAPPSARPRVPLPPAATTRLDSLTGLRFFAAFLVVTHHVTGNFAVIPAISSMSEFGASGVTFFFVLSGFVLTWSWREGDPARDFYWRRFARVWPLHLVLLVPPVVGFAAARGVDWTAAGASALLLQAWFPDLGVYYGGNPVAWSLSCELFFYALFPLVIRRVVAFPVRGLFPAMACVLALMLAGDLAVRGSLPAPLVSYVLTVSPGYRVLHFIFGVLLAVAVRRGLLSRVRLLPAFVALAVCPLFLWGSLPYLEAPLASTLVSLRSIAVPLAYGALIVAAARQDVEGRPSGLRHGLLVRLGHWSFALYLLHLTVIFALRQILGPQVPSNTNVVDLVLVTVGCVVLSGLLFSWIERPVERWLRRHAPGTRQAVRRRRRNGSSTAGGT